MNREVAIPLRRARVAVSTLFFVNAVLYSNLVPRLPDVKARLALDNAAFGSGIAALSVGALLAGLLAPGLIARLGSARIASVGLVLLAIAVAAVPWAGSWLAFAGVMIVIGGLDAVVDVAQNAHGFRVQRRYGRSIVHAFHGVWSIGAVAGGALGSLAIALSIPLSTHLAVSAVGFGGAALLADRFLLPGPENAERVAAAPPGTEPTRQWRSVLGMTPLLGAFGLLAICGALVEDAGASWSALYLRDEVGAAAALGGFGFVTLQLAMTVGRLTGDRAVERYGQRRVTRVGGAAIALGMGLMLTVPSLASTLVGFALAGVGVATLIPAVMHAADELPGLPDGVGLALVSWLLRIGFLVSPILIGFVADAISLRIALAAVVVAGVLVVGFGRLLDGRSKSRGRELVEANLP